jgi:hypothetical protein
MIYSVTAPFVTLPPTSMWSCGNAEFGQISRSFALNSGAIRLKRPKNLTQIGFPSLRSVKPDRLLGIYLAGCQLCFDFTLRKIAGPFISQTACEQGGTIGATILRILYKMGFVIR